MASVLWKPWCSPSLCQNLPKSPWSLLSNLTIVGPLRALTFCDFPQDSISGICLTSWEHKGICWWQGEDHGVILSDNVYSTSVICVLQGSWGLNHMCCICINGTWEGESITLLKCLAFTLPSHRHMLITTPRPRIMVLQDERGVRSLFRYKGLKNK